MAYDVVVVGAGIAGVSAALEAAHTGARVLLCSLGNTFSGSSFYGGTWGLGLVGPIDDKDAADFERTILEVGCGQADPALVHELVEGIPGAIAWLEEMGVVLRRPTDPSQREFIPCFDHKTRSWHGLERASLRTTWAREMARCGISCLPRAELVDLMVEDDHISGALIACHDGPDSQLLSVPCSAVVLASGGLAGLYDRALCAPDVSASVHGIALAHGCSLHNAEFLQIMPGIVEPVCGVVLNEKAFRYATLDVDQELLEERSGYGPFTTRLASHAIDLAIAAAGPAGLPLSYRLPTNAPELVRDYFAWLERDFGLRPTDEVRVALYAHASNGGIHIDENASCIGGPQGLFACGECSGGVHGADRVGGIASATALVFGRIAGKRAAAEADRSHAPEAPIPCDGMASPHATEALRELRRTLSVHALVGRTQAGLDEALRVAEHATTLLQDTSVASNDVREVARTSRTLNQLAAARAMLLSMRARTRSCGSHHRADSA